MNTHQASTYIPLSQEQIDGLISEVMEKLRRTRLIVSEDELRNHAVHIQGGVEYLSSRFTGWWNILEKDEIDLHNPDTQPLKLIIRRFRPKPNLCGPVSTCQAYDFAFLPENGSNLEIICKNFLWNAWIEEVRAHATMAACA